MKTKIKSNLIIVVICMMAFSSCSLDEYNPSGSTATNVYGTEAGMNTLVNASYYNFSSQFYGREDIMFLTEGG